MSIKAVLTAQIGGDARMLTSAVWSRNVSQEVGKPTSLIVIADSGSSPWFADGAITRIAGQVLARPTNQHPRSKSVPSPK